MSRQALGLIETVGLAAAVTAADAAVKAANVKLLGYEFAKGGGLTTVKLFGDVGAVTAAVAAGNAAAIKVNRVFSSHVIPRPHQEIDGLLFTKDTVGWQKQASGSSEADVVAPEQGEAVVEVAAVEVAIASDTVLGEEAVVAESKESVQTAIMNETTSEADSQAEVKKTEKKPEDLCNLCSDPVCERRKGEPRVNCIHYDEHKNREES